MSTVKDWQKSKDAIKGAGVKVDVFNQAFADKSTKATKLYDGWENVRGGDTEKLDPAKVLKQIKEVVTAEKAALAAGTSYSSTIDKISATANRRKKLRSRPEPRFCSIFLTNTPKRSHSLRSLRLFGKSVRRTRLPPPRLPRQAKS